MLEVFGVLVLQILHPGGELEYESPDLPFGLGSGAGTIYGTTGGVAEAVVRFCLPDKSKNVLRSARLKGAERSRAYRPSARSSLSCFMPWGWPARRFITTVASSGSQPFYGLEPLSQEDCKAEFPFPYTLDRILYLRKAPTTGLRSARLKGAERSRAYRPSARSWPTPRSCSRRSKRATPISTWWRS